jgi:hypothetical protein
MVKNKQRLQDHGKEEDHKIVTTKKNTKPQLYQEEHQNHNDQEKHKTTMISKNIIPHQLEGTPRPQ